LADGAEFEGESMVVPDIAIPEVMNAIFVQHHVLHLIEDGRPYLERLFRIIDAELIEVVESTKDLILEAYQIAARNRGATYDCLFIALALRTNLQLKTRDRRLAEIMETEKSRKMQGGHFRRGPT
jgi:predicted nucleic acid-binding protein